MVKKNQFLELLRFIFCLIIIIHHSAFVSGGATFRFEYGGQYAVEFFFLLTGAFAMKHLLSGNPKEDSMVYSLDYTLKKLKRIFPYACVGIVLCYAWYFVQADWSKGLKDTLWGRWNILFELTFLPMSGVMDINLNNYLNSPLWYLSVVLLGLPLIMYMAIKLKDLYSHYLSWVLPLFMHAYLLQKYGTIAGWGTYTGSMYFGVIRGVADMMLGSFLYIFANAISSGTLSFDKASLGNSNSDKKASKDSDKSFIFTIVEIILLAFSVYMFSSNVNEGYTYEFAVIVMALAIGISLSGKSYTSEIGNKFKGLGMVFSHLGKLSLPMYCLHWPVYRFVSEYGLGLSYLWAMIIVLGINLALSEMLIYLFDNQRGLFSKK